MLHAVWNRKILCLNIGSDLYNPFLLLLCVYFLEHQRIFFPALARVLHCRLILIWLSTIIHMPPSSLLYCLCLECVLLVMRETALCSAMLKHILFRWAQAAMQSVELTTPRYLPFYYLLCHLQILLGRISCFLSYHWFILLHRYSVGNKGLMEFFPCTEYLG